VQTWLLFWAPSSVRATSRRRTIAVASGRAPWSAPPPPAVAPPAPPAPVLIESPGMPMPVGGAPAFVPVSAALPLAAPLVVAPPPVAPPPDVVPPPGDVAPPPVIAPPEVPEPVVLPVVVPPVTVAPPAPAKRPVQTVYRERRLQQLGPPLDVPDPEGSARGVDGQEPPLRTPAQVRAPPSRSRQVHDLPVVGDAADGDVPLRVRAGVVAGDQVESPIGRPFREPFPPVREADVGERQAGDGLVAEVQEVLGLRDVEFPD